MIRNIRQRTWRASSEGLRRARRRRRPEGAWSKELGSLPARRLERSCLNVCFPSCQFVFAACFAPVSLLPVLCNASRLFSIWRRLSIDHHRPLRPGALPYTVLHTHASMSGPDIASSVLSGRLLSQEEDTQ
eukprot:1569250-Rhodomonas_salina.1